MLCEDEQGFSTGGESDWVDETCGGEGEKSCGKTFHGQRSGRKAPRVRAGSADEFAVPPVAPLCAKPVRGTRHALSSAVAVKEATLDTAAISSSERGRRVSTSPRASSRGFRKCRPKNELRKFRCKGFTFEWGGDDAAEIPAYDLSPSLKLLRLSLDASVDDAPANVLRSFFRAFEAADASSRTKFAAGASLTFHVDQRGAPAKTFSGSKHPAAERAGGGGNVQKNKQRAALEASYFAPLGDELYVGQSPQRLQLLSPNRFLGTLDITAGSSSSVVAPASMEPHLQSSDATTADENEDSADGSSPAQPNLADWQKEPSFVTWHRMRVVGADPSAGGAPEVKDTSAEKEEATPLSFAEDDDEAHGKKVKKKKKSKRDPSEVY